MVDKIILGVFSFFFLVIQVAYGIWMFYARRRVRELEIEENNFVSALNEKLSQATIRSKIISKL